MRRLLRVGVEDELAGVADEGGVVTGQEVVVEGARGEGEVAAAVQVPLPRHVGHHHRSAVSGPVAVHELDGVAPAVPCRPRVLRRKPAAVEQPCSVNFADAFGRIHNSQDCLMYADAFGRILTHQHRVKTAVSKFMSVVMLGLLIALDGDALGTEKNAT